MNLKKTLTKGLSLGLACALSLSLLTGCGGGSSSSDSTGVSTPEDTAPVMDSTPNTEKSDETFTFILEGEPTSLTALSSSTGALVISEAIGGSLLRYNDETKTAEPEIASSYDTIDDTHYRFHLREDAVYADGTPVTANDVLYSFQRYKEMGNQDFVNIDVENCVVEDEHTFVLALTEYFAGWEFCVSEGSSAIYSQAAVEAAGGLDAPQLAPVSCGRYTFKEWKPGQYILLERNENYWNKDYVGYYKYLKFTFMSDSASRVMSVRSGDADAANRVAASDFISLQNDATAYGWSYDCGVDNQIFFNCESGLTADPALREAIAHAIDPEAVNAVMNLGVGEVVQGLWGKAFPYYRDYYGESLYNPDLAKEQLAALGYNNNLTLKCICTAVFKDPATVIQESLRQVGVTLDVEILESAAFLPAARGGEYDIIVGNNAVACLSSNAFNNIDPDKIGAAVYNTRINTPELSEAISKANSPDEATREEGFDEIYDIVLGSYAVVGLCNGDKYVAVKQGITGLKVGTRMGYVDVSECHPA